MRDCGPSKAVTITVVLFFGLCAQARAGDGTRAVIHRSAPIYPELAKQMHLGGSVILVVSVDSEGSVTEVKVQSGHPLLLQSAISAVRMWKFAPAQQPSQTTISVNFESH